MKVILFYTPFLRRSRDTESLMLRFRSLGYHVISLTQGDGKDINPFLESHGIEAHAYPVRENPAILFYLRHLLFFIRFCRRKNVSVVFSHLDPANFVTSIGQYFIRAKVYLCRHHINEASLYDYHTSLSYTLTNFFAKKIIVVSQRSFDYVANVEGVPRSKLLHINLAYDFSLYKSPEKNDVDNLRKQLGGELLLITICRLTQYKRPILSIEVVKKLREKGLDVKLVILGSGDLRDELEKVISSLDLRDHVFLEGHVSNVLTYLGASDFLVHPSVLESSCVAVKEAGLMQKPVIVCRSIGDFDEYIKDGHNGFLVSESDFVNETVDVIVDNFRQRDRLAVLGENLKKDVIRLFDIENVFSKYDGLY